MNKAAKVRLDVLLVERGLFPTREVARRAIMAGMVSQAGQVISKPGTQVRGDENYDVKQPEHQFVSRGGLKLQKALQVFPTSCTGQIVLDVGASTGGFTDCALQNGASHVYAVDVGYGQLAWKLRSHDRVTVMERTNFRHVTREMFDPRPNFAVMDVSFISTKLLFPTIGAVCHPASDVISLIKPQFEAGRGNVGKGGIVRDREVHLAVILDILSYIESIGWACKGLDFSPISGGDGNIEFLACWNTDLAQGSSPHDFQQRASELVELAWTSIHTGTSIS